MRKETDYSMLVVQNLTEENVSLVANLEKECFVEDAWSENLLRAEINQPDKHYFLLFLNDKFVAYGGFLKVFDEADIMNIAVSAEFRRCGFGMKILECIFDKGKQLGISRFTLEVRESNIPARTLYEKAGFVFSGVRKKYYRNKENCCIYWKVITEELS